MHVCFPCDHLLHQKDLAKLLVVSHTESSEIMCKSTILLNPSAYMIMYHKFLWRNPQLLSKQHYYSYHPSTLFCISGHSFVVGLGAASTVRALTFFPKILWSHLGWILFCSEISCHPFFWQKNNFNEFNRCEKVVLSYRRSKKYTLLLEENPTT